VLVPRYEGHLPFATAAHANQSRNFSGRPYIEYSVAVARMVNHFVHDKDMLLAAVLHDAVVNPPVSVEGVSRAIGGPVALLVADLTDGNRAVRQVKRMDLLHNCVSIVRHDRGFAGYFLLEMKAMLTGLRDASGPAAGTFAQRMHRPVVLAAGDEAVGGSSPVMAAGRRFA
jgi:hypothetical protein